MRWVWRVLAIVPVVAFPIFIFPIGLAGSGASYAADLSIEAVLILFAVAVVVATRSRTVA